MKICATEEPAGAGRAAGSISTSPRNGSCSIRRSSIPAAARRSTSTRLPTTASTSRCRCRRDGSEVGTGLRARRRDGQAACRHGAAGDVPTAGGSIEWAARQHGLLLHALSGAPASDRRRTSSFYQTVWFHRLGTPVATDRYVIGREFPRIAEIALHGSRDGTRPGRAASGTATAARSPIASSARAAPWQRVADFTDGIKEMEHRAGRQSLRALDQGRAAGPDPGDPAGRRASRARARSSFPKRRCPPIRWRSHARGSTSSIATAARRVVKMFDLAGSARRRRCPSEPVSDTTVSAILDGDNAIVRVMSFVTPSTRYRYDARREPPRRDGAQRQAAVQFRRRGGRARHSPCRRTARAFR